MIATLVLVVLSLIPPPPDETIIDGQENFSLTVGSEPRAGFTFWREWGTKGTEHFLSIRITSPSRSEVDFWEVWERHNREGEVSPNRGSLSRCVSAASQVSTNGHQGERRLQRHRRPKNLGLSLSARLFGRGLLAEICSVFKSKISGHRQAWILGQVRTNNTSYCVCGFAALNSTHAPNSLVARCSGVSL